MKSIKKIIVLIISLLVVGMTASKIIPMFESGRLGANEHGIYNNEEKILAQKDTYSYLRKKLNNSANNIDLRFIEFTGIDTMYYIESHGNSSINIEYDSQLTKGEFKVLLISPNNEIINILDGNINGNKGINIVDGKSRIKIVGNSSTGNLHLNINSKDNVSISVSKL